MRVGSLCLVLGALLLSVSGCNAVEKLPEGAQFSTSTFGLRISPQPLDGNPIVFGHHSTILNTPTPPGAGPNINRHEIAGPFTHQKSTTAQGPVGSELEKAGGPKALGHLVSPARRPSITFPRTESQEGESD